LTDFAQIWYVGALRESGLVMRTKNDEWLIASFFSSFYLALVV